MKIPIAQPMIGEEEIEEVKQVLKSGILAQGPKVEKFEKNFAKFVGTKFAVATSSGTTALHLALLAAGIKVGDEVITTPFTFIATTNSILYIGAKPIFADIQEDTFNLDPKSVESKITKKTRSILVVHLYGQMADIKKI
ncbi:MAG: glutamine--scyllo-inositol transaminase, partial [Candidatus Berkelbacteria bacterium Licking1014_85]